jgi:hypothetical protein
LSWRSLAQPKSHSLMRGASLLPNTCDAARGNAAHVHASASAHRQGGASTAPLASPLHARAPAGC